MKLTPHLLNKPWGRHDLPPPFVATGERIGEIWFVPPAGEEQKLLVKYILTGEKLSVQVHPDDAQGCARGLPGGKTEWWYILDAEPGARLGIGTTRPLSDEELRAAALDNSIEGLIDWKAVNKGDTFFVPAGTIHAIGGGISLVEIQQNVDVTYRLYDYGRPRELHLDDGVAVSTARPYPPELTRKASGAGIETLVEGDPFTVVASDDLATTRAHLAGRELWVVPLAGVARSGEDEARPGECLWLSGSDDLAGDPGTWALIGATPR